MSAVDKTALEAEIQQLGRNIFHKTDQLGSSPLTREFYNSWLLDWSMKNPAFKIQLFRFIDVLPTLDSPLEITRHAREYFLPVADALPAAIRTALFLGKGKLSSKMAAPLIKDQVEKVAQQFIAGETAEAATEKLEKLSKDGFSFICCFLGDAVLSKEESLVYQNKYVDLIQELTKKFEINHNSSQKFADYDGQKAAVHISVKLSTLYSQIRPLNYQRSLTVLSERFAKIASEAKKNKAHLCIDMEESSFVSTTIETLKIVLQDKEFCDWDGLGIVLQAYSKRTEADLEDLVDFSKKRGVPLGIRLVKGAYWDTETLVSAQNNWPSPVWSKKSQSDASFEKLARNILDNIDVLYPAFGSHNIRSLSAAVAYAKLKKIPQQKFELQFLFGMAQAIKEAYQSEGFLVRDYVPIGELIPGMGYLVRRLLENTSNEGFLRLKFHSEETPEKLLSEPNPDWKEELEENTAAKVDSFLNISPQDYSLSKSRKNIWTELERQKQVLQKKPAIVRPIVSGKELKSTEILAKVSPNQKGLQIAKVELANLETLEHALTQTSSAQAAWAAKSAEYRANLLTKAAKQLEIERDCFTASIVIEIGKTIEEADAEVAEAIDFLNYYAIQAVEIDRENPVLSFPGEQNNLHFEARGCAAIIGPWNFPLAIPCGMLAAALVTGNACLLKPAEQSSLIAYQFFKLLLAVGVPSEVIAFLPGRGELIGKALVSASQISTIAFTGSKEVGLKIVEVTARTSPKQKHLKRVIAEMGGKNSIIIDSDADLDEAVEGVLRSAFSFQGQKCSACSKAIIVGEKKYQAFAARIGEAMKSMPLGPSWSPENYAGPVIDLEQQQRIIAFIEAGKQTAEVLVEHPALETDLEDGFYVPPIIFHSVSSEDPLRREEIFGPVLLLISASNFDQALEIANENEFGLTGAVFSRSPKHISLARSSFEVGNLYINQKSTGAIVARQPFGGAKMSGLGSKAGGPDYLKQFMNPRVVCENTLRRGFSPELEELS